MRLYLREIEAAPRLTDAEESALLPIVATGCERSRDRLIRAYLWLVVKTARRFPIIPTLPLEDLIAEGNLGLMKAADRYRVACGSPFAAVATTLIREAIYKAITDKGKIIRIPASAMKRLRREGGSGVLAVSLDELSPDRERAETWQPADEDAPDMADVIDSHERIAQLKAIWSKLSPKEAAVLARRFDLPPEYHVNPSRSRTNRRSQQTGGRENR